MSAAQPVILGEMPSLSKLYVNAAAQAARRRVLGTHDCFSPASHRTRSKRRQGRRRNLTAYQHLIGLTARDTLPAGYLHALSFPLAISVMNRDDFPLPLLGMIHLSNYVEQRAPVLFTELLDIEARVENLRGHRAGTQLDVVAEVRGGRDPGCPLDRPFHLPGEGCIPAGDRQTLATNNGQADFTPPDPTAVWHLGVDTGRAYAAVSGDFNPIHLSVLSAKALGMRRSIAHGMYLASRALADVGPVKGEAFTWAVTFEAPVFLPGRVALEITLIKRRVKAGSAPTLSRGTRAPAENTSAAR